MFSNKYILIQSAKNLRTLSKTTLGSSLLTN